MIRIEDLIEKEKIVAQLPTDQMWDLIQDTYKMLQTYFGPSYDKLSQIDIGEIVLNECLFQICHQQFVDGINAARSFTEANLADEFERRSDRYRKQANEGRARLKAKTFNME